MGWELVDEQPNGIRTFIDGVFRLTITHIKTMNIHDWVWNDIDGKPTPAVSERDTFKLWHGAHLVLVTQHRDEVLKVVSQLRTKDMEKGKRK